MKQIVSNYTYSPTANCVTLAGLNIDQDQLLLVVAPQVGRTLYNFASVTGTVIAGTDTRINLTASTAGLTTTSSLVIFYDDQLSAGTVTANLTTESFSSQGGIASDGGGDEPTYGVQLGYYSGPEEGYKFVNTSQPLPISGTVTVSSLPAGIASDVENALNAYAANSNDPLPIALPVGLSTSSVTVSNFPATQTISGTVTANIGDGAGFIGDGHSTLHGLFESGSLVVGAMPAISGTVTVGNSVTIGSLPDIAIGISPIYDSGDDSLSVNIKNIGGGASLSPSSTFPVSGTVTANINDPTNVLIAQQISDALFASDTLVNALNSGLFIQSNVPFGTVTANLSSSNLNSVTIGVRGTVTVGNSITIGSLPAISGTVTVGNVAGFNIPTHDYKSFGYTDSNLTQIAYKTGGASGTTVGILTLAYDGNGNLTSMTKS